MDCPKDVIYFYDGSFEGFLCCVFESYQNHEVPQDIWQWATRQMTMFPTVAVATDQKRADRVFASICTKLGALVKQMTMDAFLNGEEGKEIRILRFLRLCYDKGPSAAKMLGHPAVADVLALEKAVMGEAHLLKGFVRFEEREGMLGAIISPKHYVLPLLRGHFCARFPQEDFAIFDKTHNIALLRQNRQVQYLEFDNICITATPEEHEAAYQRMWKNFYETLTIEERRNEKLRQTHCPKRFWQNMVEMQNLA